jgi:dGTPase
MPKTKAKAANLELESSDAAKKHDARVGMSTASDPAALISREISRQAHIFVKSQTKYLSELREDGGELRLKRVHIPKRKGTGRNLYDKRSYFRLHDSAVDPNTGVSAFAKDFARVAHSPAFRRLGGKSQLVPADENDFFRTRLTHSLEVAEIASRIARQINHKNVFFKKRENNIDDDLINCSCLLHDIGHPPFGHSGEHVLNRLMTRDGFEGNAQTLRIITCLENRLGRDTSVEEAYSAPRGLNLTARTIASIVKYDQLSVPTAGGEPGKGYYDSEKLIVEKVKKTLNVPQEVRLYTLECQIMDIADDIAYSAYDLEDTMEAGIVGPLDAMSISDEMLNAMTVHINNQLKKRDPKLKLTQTNILEVLSDVFGAIVYPLEENHYHLTTNKRDQIAYVGRTYLEAAMHAKNPLVRRQFLETLIQRNIDSIDVEVDEERPMLSRVVIQRERLIAIECMKAFNFHKVIRSKRLQYPNYRNTHVVEYLFQHFIGDSKLDLLTFEEKRYCIGGGCHPADPHDPKWKRFVCDKIASLTDREAIQIFNKLNPAGEQSFFGYL